MGLVARQGHLMKQKAKASKKDARDGKGKQAQGGAKKGSGKQQGGGAAKPKATPAPAPAPACTIAYTSCSARF